MDSIALIANCGRKMLLVGESRRDAGVSFPVVSISHNIMEAAIAPGIPHFPNPLATYHSSVCAL